MLTSNSLRRGGQFALLALIALSLLLVSSVSFAQTTVAQGSIQGTITDPSSAVVSGAKITITNKATNQVSTVTSSSSGTYNSGGLIPGDYVVRVEAPGFKTTQLPVVVQVAVTSSGNVKLEIGQGSTVVEVQGSAVTVNTEQATVQGVLTADEIDKMPVDGRNFLDLAQLEPGVQIQDGQTFDPTKAGYSSISINGVYGRTPRIELDGLDISDETVGTTTQNIGLGSIQEFNISRSGLDLSTELTSAGSVNVTTRSGTNSIHGQGFYNVRDRNAGVAPFPGDQTGYYQRNNFGGRVGGPIIKDKAFFFFNAEKNKQDGLLPVTVPQPFQALSGGFLSPFRDTDLTAKLDWNATKDIHVFYRYSDNWNKSEANFGYDYQVYANRDYTQSHAVGADWNKGSWSNSFRFGYLKFHNLIGDATAGASFVDPLPQAELLFFDINTQLSGPNLLAPQQTFQSNKQFKYDGSKVYKSHIFRFGAGYNDIQGGGFASFFGIAPLLEAGVFTGPVIAGNPPMPGGNPADPTAYPLLGAILGNGQGFFTEKPNFGFPGGGQSDHRFQAYVGDSWKVKPNFTFTYGLRYNRDTGRSDSDLAPIPCSVTTLITCTGNLLDQWGAGFGNRIKQPNTQFGPQVGFAWDPQSNGKTAIRGGFGIYYENSIFNNTLFDRPAKLATGLFFQSQTLGCAGPGTTTFNIPGQGNVTTINGVDLGSGVCGQPFSTAAPLVFDLQQEYQAAVRAQGPVANPSYVGNTLEISTSIQGLSAYDPNYRSARSYQINFGVQRQIGKGVFTADYIRNVSTRFMLTIDRNHVGDARFLDLTSAQAAIATTLTNCGVATIQASYSAPCPSGFYVDPNTGLPRPATINDYAADGLDSGNAFGGAPAASTGAAFGGINRNVGQGDFEIPEGRSIYNALQTSYKQQIANPFRGIGAMNLTVAYTLSRFVGDGGNDQNFSATAFDNNNPSYFTGPTSLDRTHQFKFGLTFDVAHKGPRFSVIGNFASAPPTTLLFTSASSVPETVSGEIFRTDLTGDGSVSDLFPVNSSQSAGKPGQFMRSVNERNLSNSIANWNSTQAGTLTPAGQALVSQGLFTTADLQNLGAVKPFVAPPPPGATGNHAFREVSAVLSWPIRVTERFTVEPSIAAYNVLGLANFSRLDGHLNNQGTPFAPGQFGPDGNANGTVLTHDGNNPNNDISAKIGTGSGVFNLGAPRQVEFGIKLSF
jgi:hypothetical protein